MSEVPAARTPQDGSPLATAYDVALLDLDGVVYSGDEAVPGAAEALAGARALGMGRVFVTNNASRTPAVVVDHLVSLGVPAEPSDVVTSAQAAAGRLAQLLPEGARVLVVGGEGLLVALRERGLHPVSSADDQPAAVVQGFSPTTTWQMLMEACVGLRAGVPWVVTNSDATLPTPRGEGPGNGALVDVVRAVVGRAPDEVTGKPCAPIMDEARRRRQSRRPLVVGDRLDTDIEAAQAAGMESLLVLTGVTGLTALLSAPPQQRPTFVAPDLSGLLRHGQAAHPEDGWWRCGEVAVRVRGHGATTDVDIAAAGDPRRGALPVTDDPHIAAHVVHAAAAACWSLSGERPETTAVVRGLLASWAAPFGWDR
jgi:HAD superfamily hydrolase (TIGR01450 family)